MQEDYLQPDCVPLVIKMFSDGTRTGATGSHCPIVITLANFDKALQSSDAAKLCIGYVPKVNGVGASPAKVSKMRRQVYHFCMEKISSSLKAVSKMPVTIVFGRRFIRVQPFVKNLIYDGPEARKAALVKSQCIRCLCPRQLMASDNLFDVRMNAKMMQFQDEAKQLELNQSGPRDGTATRIAAIEVTYTYYVYI